GGEGVAAPPVVRRATHGVPLGGRLRAAHDRTLATPPAPAELERPPLPVPGCEACAWLAERRETARAAFDHSAVTDANVLLRQHQRKEHEG
ncbi:hypothetical protein ABVB25_29460, partial [Streptomyces anthocyanicus]|uniref:hypothetical protein n=1 Tax=Streptomyces anthocyanicus TaxID=68174 RepID=UPI00336AA9CC